MAPHACEGPIGGLATLHVDAAMPNFVVQEICSSVDPARTEKVWEEWLGSRRCGWWTDDSHCLKSQDSDSS